MSEKQETFTQNARDFVMTYLHSTGEKYDTLTSKQETDIRYFLANGFGNLSEQDLDQEMIQDMMWDWSHVRDSSDCAFEQIKKYIQTRI